LCLEASLNFRAGGGLGEAGWPYENFGGKETNLGATPLEGASPNIIATKLKENI